MKVALARALSVLLWYLGVGRGLVRSVVGVGAEKAVAGTTHGADRPLVTIIVRTIGTETQRHKALLIPIIAIIIHLFLSSPSDYTRWIKVRFVRFTCVHWHENFRVLIRIEIKPLYLCAYMLSMQIFKHYKRQIV